MLFIQIDDLSASIMKNVFKVLIFLQSEQRSARRASHCVPKVTIEKIQPAQWQHHQSVISLNINLSFLLHHATNICLIEMY